MLNFNIVVDVGDYSKLHSKGFKEYMSGWMILIDGLIGRDISEFPTVYELLLQLAGILISFFLLYHAIDRNNFYRSFGFSKADH